MIFLSILTTVNKCVLKINKRGGNCGWSSIVVPVGGSFERQSKGLQLNRVCIWAVLNRPCQKVPCDVRSWIQIAYICRSLLFRHRAWGRASSLRRQIDRLSQTWGGCYGVLGCDVLQLGCWGELSFLEARLCRWCSAPLCQYAHGDWCSCHRCRRDDRLRQLKTQAAQATRNTLPHATPPTEPTLG